MTKYTCLLLAALCLHTTHVAWGQAPAVTTFESLVAHLTKEDVRALRANRDAEETRKLAQSLSAPLKKLEGQKITLEFTAGDIGPSAANKEHTLIHAHRSNTVKVHGVPLSVKILVTVEPGLANQLKECHEGRKITVTGAVTSGSLWAGLSTAAASSLGTQTLGLSLSLQAESLGRAK